MVSKLLIRLLLLIIVIVETPGSVVSPP